MTDFLMALLAATIIGSLIWLLLTLLKPLTQKIFSQTWHYYAGLIPAFFLLGAAWVISAGIDAMTAPIRPIAPVISESSSTAEGLAPPTFIYNCGGVIEKTGETVAKARLSIEMFVPFILAVWLIGALAFLVWKSAAYAHFRRSITRIGKLSDYTDCKLLVLVCPGVTTPMLVGVFKPVIVMPERNYSNRERALILSHEMTHWQHGDMFIKLFLLIVNALHWFNPLVYQMNKDTARLCENACDETLIKNMDITERVLYGELILSTVSYKKAPALCSAMSEGKNLKRRLSYMLKGKKMNKPVMMLALIVVCAVVAGGVWLALSINDVYDFAEKKSALNLADAQLDERVSALDLADAQLNERISALDLADAQLDERVSALDLADEILDNSYLWPLADYTQVSASFGTRIHPVEKTEISHRGIDIAAPSGTPILAAKSGTIGEIGENSTDGLYVVLDHGAGLKTFYAHMNKYAEGLINGDSIDKGDIIGYVGSTGESTGSHLHFGISVDGVYINPLEGFKQ